MSLNESGQDAARETPRLPGASFQVGNGPAPVRPDDGDERNAVFESLVTGDADIVGLVAYSIYKQNKHDWLVAFDKARGRGPNEAEMTAYILGESTPRRLAIYRHLAEATLEGRGPEVPAGPASEAFAQRTYGAAARRASKSSGSSLVTWLVVAAVAIVLILLAARFGIPGVTPGR
jgi:hypothetical protein